MVWSNTLFVDVRCITSWWHHLIHGMSISYIPIWYTVCLSHLIHGMSISYTRYVYIIHLIHGMSISYVPIWYTVCLSHLIHGMSISYIWYTVCLSLIWYTVCLSHTFCDTRYVSLIWYTVCLSHLIHGMSISSDTQYVYLIHTVCLYHTSDTRYVYLIHSWYIYKAYTVLDHQDIIEYIVRLSHTFLTHIHDVHCMRWWWHHLMHCKSISYILDTHTRHTLY